MRQMLSFTLKGAGYDVIEAVDGVDALNKAKNANPDAVLTDVNMPNMDGITLIQELRKLPNYKHTPMLMLTTESSGDMKMKGKAAGALGVESFGDRAGEKQEEFNIFKKLARAEWDTLMFFYGVILCVGGLGTMGYLAALSEFMYVDSGSTKANILVGFLSAVIDNIPVMFAVLTMLPEMDTTQWLLVTLTAGTGGSLLSVGSAAGVAVMGQARGYLHLLCSS